MHLQEWSKSRILITPNASKVVQQQEFFHSLLVGIQNGRATLQNIWVDFYKTKDILTIWSAMKFLDIYPRELKIYVPTKTYTLMSEAALFTNCQNLEAVEMTFCNWMNN